jgi:hypothetical protein
MLKRIDLARRPSRGVRRGLAIVVLTACAALIPSLAAAQSAFNGRASDATGAVLPGVTVEVASPSLIGGARNTVTDEQGRYTITDLRPGQYTITFTLPGFSTTVRNEINLPADFTMTINAEMKVGGIEETLTVTGDAPVVDVTQAQKTEVLSREQLDSLPTGKTLQARAALMPLITTNVDVGGSMNMDQHNIRTAGLEDNEVSVFVDGMLLNSNSSDGASQYYFNDAMPQQVSMQTSGVDAETQAGGVRINVVPKEGGNQVHGSVYIDGANDKMMSSNLSDRLKGLGVDSVDSLARAYDFNAGVGGPIKENKLWWFFTGHRKALDQKVLGSFYPDGTPGVNDVIIHGMQVRLTWQISSKHKWSAFYDDNNKVEYHNFSAGEDILTVAQTRGVNKKGPRYAAQTKWTGTFSSKLLAEAGWGTNRVDYVNRGLEGTRKDRPANVRTCLATPCLSFDPAQAGPSINPWYTTTSNFDPEKPIFRWGNVTDDFHKVPQRYVVTTKVTYVTGSHNLKFGVQDTFGPENWTRIDNADLQSVEYRSGLPESVVVRNSPTASSGQVNKDLGVYAQDSWHVNRLTLSPGVRLEWFNSQVNDETAPAGRWVAARNFESFKINPAWFDVSPRFGLAYDVFGDAKTAIKFDAGKYVHALTLSLVDRYNPMFATTERRLWADCYRDGPGGLSCSGANPYGTNGDRIVQDWEIAPGASNFGARNVNTTDPDLKRDYYFRTGVSIEHEMARNIGLSAGWYYTDYRNMRTYVNNLGVTTNFSRNVLRNLGDYQAFQVANPLPGYEGQKITVYNLKREKLTSVQNVDTNVASESGQKYMGWVFGLHTRIHRSNLFGGVTVERITGSFCDTQDNPNQLRFCDTTGGDGEAQALGNVPGALPGSGYSKAMPYQANIKIGSDHELPYGVQLSAAFRSLPGAERVVSWSVPTTAFTAAGLTRTQAVTVRLNEPGSLYYERANIVDLGLAKWINLPGHARVKAGLNIYNLLNPDTITGQTNTFGPTLGDVTSVILGRFWRASASLQF